MTLTRHDLEPVMMSYLNLKSELSGVCISLNQSWHAKSTTSSW